MSVLETICKRRSIRKYQERQIPREDFRKNWVMLAFCPLLLWTATAIRRCVISAPFIMSRLTGVVKLAPSSEQEKWKGVIFTEQPYLANVYPGDTRNIGIIFCIRDMAIEYFNLGVNPIFRENYVIGNAEITPKGYFITEDCTGCGKCVNVCPQRAIEKGKPSVIHQEHCLHCGNCFENCPVSAIKHRIK